MNFQLPKVVIDELTTLGTPDSIATKIKDFCIYLDKWNQKINLTGSKSCEDIATDHILDSLKAAKHLPLSEAFIDIGSGAGFPGLILAMIWPDREAHLIEPKEKSANFLKEATKALGLTNVSVYIRAIEDLQGEEIVPIFQEYFSISRAFSPMKKFFGCCHYLVHEDAPIFLMTGESSEALDSEVLTRHNLTLFKSINYDTEKTKKMLVEIRQAQP